MRKNSISLFVILISTAIGMFQQRVVAQTNLPTIAQIYNYSVGDTFVYKLTNMNNNQIVMYVSRAVLSRDNSHYPDSIVYTIEETYLDTNNLNPAVYDTITKVFYNCNDTIFPYNGFLSCNENIDSCYSTTPISVTTDTLFPGLTVYHADFGCDWWSSGWNNAAQGLGIVHAYTGCGDFVLEQYDIVMVHYYKAPTGIEPLNDDDLRVTVFPNPATTQLILNSELKIDNGPPMAFGVIVTNTLGQEVKRLSIINFPLLIDISTFNNGMYLLQVFDAKGGLVKAEKVVKE